MKISVVIIGHNEAEYISHTLETVLSQSITPHEIIVVAHNCTDDTAALAKMHKGVKVIQYTSKPGCAYARAEGFSLATGDILVSLDGDSFPATRHWLQTLTAPLASRLVAGVGGTVLFWGNLYGWIMSLNFFFFDSLIKPNHWVYFWGANFAIRKKDYEKVGGLAPLISQRDKWHLTYWADDYYLSKKLSSLGEVRFVPTALVISRARKIPLASWLARSREQGRDKVKLDAALA